MLIRSSQNLIPDHLVQPETVGFSVGATGPGAQTPSGYIPNPIVIEQTPRAGMGEDHWRLGNIERPPNLRKTNGRHDERRFLLARANVFGGSFSIHSSVGRKSAVLRFVMSVQQYRCQLRQNGRRHGAGFFGKRRMLRNRPRQASLLKPISVHADISFAPAGSQLAFAARNCFLRSLGSSQILRSRMLLGVTSTYSSSAM